MKTRLLLLLTGLAIAQTLFGAVSGSKEGEPASENFCIALSRHGEFERQHLLEIKKALDEAGYLTKLVNENELKGDKIDLGIFFYPQPQKNDGSYLEICHSQNKLLAKCIGKELGRRTSLESKILDIDFPLMKPGDPVLVIGVASDIEKRCDRYARGIVEGVEEYMDELD
ncbi:MAG: hypothetical protein DRP64_06955 [Verrucomicrobia bacterium]|nr:MAG: hypothetical protein DRP64_06955 [Verrucomicrobiota bacterium]